MKNELYRGVKGLAGEMGHITIDLNGLKCSCGNRGCWELYASEKALLKSLPHHLQKSSLQELTEQANQNNPEILMALENFGYYLGIGLTSILNTFNPEAVIIRNDVIEALPMVLNSVRNSISLRIHHQFANSYDLLLSLLGKNATALGASSLVIEHFLEAVCA